MRGPAAARAALGATLSSPRSAPRASSAPVGPFLPSRSRRRRRRGRTLQRARPYATARESADGAGPSWVPLSACVALACVSLLGPSEPTYDPWAWIIWGREITEWNLVTTFGPSWKPLPVLFTTPFALLGDSAAPALWLVVARAGGLLAVWMAYRLATRVGGRPAGVVAALALLLSDEFVRNFARGNSEGLLVALCLWAVELHLDGRRTPAFLLGFAAALLRPEVWPFFGLYGLWLAASEPDRRVLVVGVFATTGILWLLPEYLGSGDLLRAAERARQANPDSAAHAARPFLEVFRRAGGLLAPPVWVGGLVAIALAALGGRARPGTGTILALGAAAAVLMVAVGLMTEAGFAGNLRYVALPTALVCVLAGIGWSWLVAGAAARFGSGPATALGAVLLAVSAPFALSSGTAFARSMSALADEVSAYDDLDRAIAASGGQAATQRCGPVITGPYEVQVLAWKLHRHGVDLDVVAGRSGTIFAPRGTALARTPGFELVAGTEQWVVRRACAP